MRTLGTISIAVVFASLAGCQVGELRECDTRLWLAASREGDAALVDGGYEITYAHDGETGTAHCTISDGAHEVVCEGLEAQPELPLFGSPEAAHTVIVIDDVDAPADVGLRIVRDGIGMLDAQLEPDYEVRETGGQTCKRADINLVLAD